MHQLHRSTSCRAPTACVVPRATVEDRDPRVRATAILVRAANARTDALEVRVDEAAAARGLLDAIGVQEAVRREFDAAVVLAGVDAVDVEARDAVPCERDRAARADGAADRDPIGAVGARAKRRAGEAADARAAGMQRGEDRG